MTDTTLNWSVRNWTDAEPRDYQWLKWRNSSAFDNVKCLQVACRRQEHCGIGQAKEVLHSTSNECKRRSKRKDKSCHFGERYNCFARNFMKIANWLILLIGCVCLCVCVWISLFCRLILFSSRFRVESIGHGFFSCTDQYSRSGYILCEPRSFLFCGTLK